MGRKNYAFVNPQMLVWARSETPFKTLESVEEIAPSITAKNLEAWEKGDDYPSITEAKNLHLYINCPLLLFIFRRNPQER